MGFYPFESLQFSLILTIFDRQTIADKYGKETN